MDARTWFDTAATGFLQVVDGIDRAALGDPGLGVWDVRSLLGHTSRSFLTIESYLGPDPAREVTLSGPADYYTAAHAQLVDQNAVAERGRQAGLALGDEPIVAVHEIAHRVRSLVEGAEDDRLIGSPFGTMTLAAYLPTRAFELTVHGVDLARATHQAVPPALLEALVPAATLCAAMATPQQRIDLVLAFTGREPLPAGFSVL